MSKPYPDPAWDIDQRYREHKALMQEAAEWELMQRFRSDEPRSFSGNRAERRRQAAQARKDRP